MAVYDIDEVFDESPENPTDEELRRCEKDMESLGQIDLSAPAGTSIDDPVMMYLKELEKVPPLTEKEEEKLVARLADGDEAAKSRMTEGSLPLVVSIARQYAGQGVLFQDLIQEGTLGLMRAVDHFDAQRGFPFRTYAYWWIRQAITQTIEEQAETVRISDHLVDETNKQAEVSEQLTKELGREPTVEEIAGRMGMSVDEVQEIQRVSQDAESLHTSEEEGENDQSEDDAEDDAQDNVQDTSQDESEPSSSDAAAQKMVKQQLDEAMNSLTDEEQKVLQLRYGLGDGRARSQEEVGEELGLDQDEVQKIEAVAMEKMQQSNSGR